MKNNMTMSQSQYNEMHKAMEDLKNKSRMELEKLTFELQDTKEQTRQREEELE